MFSAFQTFGKLGALASSVARAWSPTTLFAAGEAGGLWDFSTLANLYQDSAGTTPCTAVGDPIGKVLDTSGRGNHLTQATSTKRPTLGRMPATGVRNLLVNTDTLSTQNAPTAAGSYTLKFTGSGTVTLSGTYSGSLVGGGTLTFTATEGTLTLTVSGSVTLAQLETGSTATAYQKVGAAYDVTEAGVASVWASYFDGVDDCLISPSINFTATDKVTAFTSSMSKKLANCSVVEFGEGVGSAGVFAILRHWSQIGDVLSQVSGSSGALYTRSNSNLVTAAALTSNATDLAGASNALVSPAFRVNGVDVVKGYVAGPVGGGMFGNMALYIGSRNNGASLQFLGFISSIVVRGAMTSGTDTLKTETWLAARTPGVTLP